MAFWKSVGDFFLGSRESDKPLSPEMEAQKLRRERLLAGLETEALGTEPTQAELAVREAGREQIESVGRQAASRAAGARGFGSVLANLTAGQDATQASQQIAGATERAAAQERANAQRAARGDLIAMENVQRAVNAEEAERRKRKGGILPGLASAGGAIVGGALGGMPGAALGAQIGGTAGSAFTR